MAAKKVKSVKPKPLWVVLYHDGTIEFARPTRKACVDVLEAVDGKNWNWGKFHTIVKYIPATPPQKARRA